MRMLLLAIAIAAGRLGAQQADTVAALRQLGQSARDPSTRSGLRLPLPTLNLTATTTEKEVKGELGVVTGTPGLLINFALTAPVDGDAHGGRTTVADRDGLSHKATVEGGLFYYKWQPRTDTVRANAVCARAKQYVDSVNRGLAPDKRTDTADVTFCSTVGKMPDQFKREMRASVRWGVPISLSLNGSWAHDQFKWIDPATLKSNKEEHENLQLRAAAASFYPPIGFLVAQYTRQRLYEGQPTTQLCTPRGTAGALACGTTAVAAPAKSDDDLFTGELRHFFGTDFAAGVVVTRNITQKVTAVEVPFYFVPDEKGKLNGGISAMWSTDDRSLRMVAFIGTMFKALYEKPK